MRANRAATITATAYSRKLNNAKVFHNVMEMFGDLHPTGENLSGNITARSAKSPSFWMN
jgi:hypothetical protein